MINPDQFWKTLELNTDRSTIMHDWNAALPGTEKPEDDEDENGACVPA